MVVLTREMVEAGLSDDGTNLNLSDNQITHLEPGVFNDLENLEDLILSHNQITYLEPDIFNGLGNLQMLDLEHNQDFFEE